MEDNLYKKSLTALKRNNDKKKAKEVVDTPEDGSGRTDMALEEAGQAGSPENAKMEEIEKIGQDLEELKQKLAALSDAFGFIKKIDVDEYFNPAADEDGGVSIEVLEKSVSELHGQLEDFSGKLNDLGYAFHLAEEKYRELVVSGLDNNELEKINELGITGDIDKLRKKIVEFEDDIAALRNRSVQKINSMGTGMQKQEKEGAAGEDPEKEEPAAEKPAAAKEAIDMENFSKSLSGIMDKPALFGYLETLSSVKTGGQEGTIYFPAYVQKIKDVFDGKMHADKIGTKVLREKVVAIMKGEKPVAFTDLPKDEKIALRNEVLAEVKREQDLTPEAIATARDFDELIEAVKNSKGIQGSKAYFTSARLVEIIEGIRNGEPEFGLDDLPQSGGLRDKVATLLSAANADKAIKEALKPGKPGAYMSGDAMDKKISEQQTKEEKEKDIDFLAAAKRTNKERFASKPDKKEKTKQKKEGSYMSGDEMNKRISETLTKEENKQDAEFMVKAKKTNKERFASESAKEEPAAVKRPTPASETEKPLDENSEGIVKKDVKEMSVEEKAALGLGLETVRSISEQKKNQFFAGLYGKVIGNGTLGFVVEKKKNSFFSKTFGRLSSLFADKAAVKEESIHAQQGLNGTLRRFFSALSDSYKNNALKAEADIKTTVAGKQNGLANTGHLVTNVIKYGRIIADFTGKTAMSPFRHVMLGAMAFVKGAEAAKEARLLNAEALSKTRVQDFTQAYKEAWKLHEQAAKDSQGRVTKEGLAKAYEKNLPKDLLQRLKRRVDIREANGVFQMIVSLDIEHSIKRINKKLEDIDKEDLSIAKKDYLKEKVIKKYSRHLKDMDRMVSQWGTVDTLAIGAKWIETSGKTVVAGLTVESLYLLVENLPEMFKNLESHISPGPKAPVLETDGRIEPIVPPIEEIPAPTLHIGGITVEVPEEALPIGNRGPEGSVIDYLKTKGVSIEQSGAAVHRMFLDWAKSEEGLKLLEAKLPDGDISDPQFIDEAMRHIDNGKVEITADGKMNITEIEFLDFDQPGEIAVGNNDAGQATGSGDISEGPVALEEVAPVEVPAEDKPEMPKPNQTEPVKEQVIDNIDEEGLVEDVEDVPENEAPAADKIIASNGTIEKRIAGDKTITEIFIKDSNMRMEISTDGKGSDSVKFSGGGMDQRLAIEKNLNDNYMEEIANSKFKTGSQFARTAVHSEALAVEQYKQALDFLEKNGQAKSVEAKILGNEIKRVINGTEKIYGNVFRD